MAMHELALMESLLDFVHERVGAERPVVIRLEVGKLCGACPEALRFCFDVCVREMGLEGSRLEILEIPGRGRCRSCHREEALESGPGLCACGSAEVELLSGRELRLKEVEVG